MYGIRNWHALPPYLPLHHRKHWALDHMLTYWCLWLPMMKIFITMTSHISFQNKKDGGGLGWSSFYTTVYLDMHCSTTRTCLACIVNRICKYQQSQ